MYDYKRIFIIGQPGAGKALLAKAVAEKLGWGYIDIDFGLESRIGRTLENILGKEGEKNFHVTQTEILVSQLNQENIVVTTDASIVCNDKNFLILENELVVFLKVSLSVQLQRQHLSKQDKSLLGINFKEFLASLHERDGLYEQMANLSIDSDDNALENHVAAITKWVLKNDELATQINLDEKDKHFFHKQMHTLISLSDQQARCLKLLAQGKSSKEIARVLHISYRTVEGTIAKIMELLGCSSSKELIALYHEKP